ncbi:MAG: TIGR01212 family radical SAM protein [Candidatus Gastranaerophilales bacterium]|nr:TIGR01212 family radical SAM protein [Candidatus Gastranaerophilales bacterium]
MFFDKNNKRYNLFSSYLKKKFNEKVYKVTLDAGFSCPNRDGTLSSSGCIFCDDSGSFSQAHSNKLDVEKQLEVGMETLKKRFKAKKFLSYFQAYSNTYKPVDKLKLLYDKALTPDDVVGLSIGTRPDCVDDEKLDLIASYSKTKEVWLEFGLQSANDKTLKMINRGHDYKCFENAYLKAKDRNINVCVHVILGLMNETYDEIMYTAKTLAKLNVDGIKFHMLCVLKNTQLEKIYNKNKFELLNEDEYVDLVCDFLEVLPPTTTIHRIAGNGLNKLLIEPHWIMNKFETLNKIDRTLEKRNSYQGMKYQ